MTQESTWPGLKNATVINMLGGLSNPNNRLLPERQPAEEDQAITLSLTLDTRALADARASGVTAVNVTVGYVAGPMEPFEHSVRQGPQQFQKIADLLVRRGHTSARIEKILGGNFLRLLEEVW